MRLRLSHRLVSALALLCAALLPLRAPAAAAPPPQPPVYFIHRATAANIVNDFETIIDHPATNDHPNAILIVTQSWNPDKARGVYNDHEIGVIYWEGRWHILNGDKEPLPEGAAFNVMVVPPSERAFLYQVPAGWSTHKVNIDHPLLNGHPEAMILLTPHWVSSVNTHPTGVYYAGESWMLTNEDRQPLPGGAGFNVVILDAAQTALVVSVANSKYEDNYVFIDHRLANRRQGALLFATQRWLGTYNAHATGVWYYVEMGSWAIFNQYVVGSSEDRHMPIGAAFNVLIAPTQVNLPLLQTRH